MIDSKGGTATPSLEEPQEARGKTPNRSRRAPILCYINRNLMTESRGISLICDQNDPGHSQDQTNSVTCAPAHCFSISTLAESVELGGANIGVWCKMRLQYSDYVEMPLHNAQAKREIRKSSVKS